MLAGIGGAVVPVVLHLLNRSRYRTVDWGAMMFLYGDDARQRQSTRLKQLLLLLVRMTLVAALAVCMARPVVRAKWAAGQDASATAVILLDRSASMSYDENGRTRFASAKAAVVSILAAMHRGDEAAVLTMGDAAGPGHDPAAVPTSDLHGLAVAVENLSVGYGPANVADGLNRAAEVFSASRRPNRELFIVCDRQASSWAQANDAFAVAWRARVGTGEPPQFVVIPVGSEAADNVAVEKLVLTNRPAVKNRPVDVEATIHNYGVTPRSGLPLSLRAGGKEMLSTPLTLGPGAETVVRATVKFPEAGPQVLTASIQTAGLPHDSQCSCAVNVLESLPVKIVSGDEPPGTLPGQSGYLALALAPFAGAKRSGPDVTAAALVGASDPKWSDALGKYRVVVLADVPQFTPAQVKDLEEFVYAGGGILIAPGARAKAAAYNEMLYKDGAGLMPASLRSATPPDGSAATALLGIDLAHPVFRFLKGKPDFIPAATVARYFPAVPRRPDGQTLASYVNGQPFLVAGAFGRGRVLLVTTPLDADWGSLPLSNFFLPFVQSAVRYLAAAERSPLNVALGEPLVAAYDVQVGGTSARMVRPDGTAEDLPLLRSGDQTEIRYTNTDLPGEYTLYARAQSPTRTTTFVVARPPGESDLTPLTKERWQWLSSTLGFKVIDEEKSTLAAAIASNREERELWPLLLAVVFVLAVAELVLERLWSREAE